MKFARRVPHDKQRLTSPADGSLTDLRAKHALFTTDDRMLLLVPLIVLEHWLEELKAKVKP